VLALQHCIDVGAAVMDGDCHGNLCLVRCNRSEKPFAISCGDSTAKLFVTQFIMLN
jgi:dUTPase